MSGTAIGLVFIVKLALMGGGVYHAFQFDPHFGWALTLISLGIGLKASK